MKRIISIILATVLILSSISIFASAEVIENDATLKFNSDGIFKILHIADIQDTPAVAPITLDYIAKTCDAEQPDLIVLGGDNAAGAAGQGSTEEKALRNMAKTLGSFMSIFEEKNIPTAVVFGNHDDSPRHNITKEMQMEIFNSYDCCIAIDEGEDIYGCGNYNIPVMSSDGKKTAYNLWFFDSNSHCPIPDCDCGEYDWVHDDQVDWYVKKSNELKKANGGKVVPSMAFQHIAVSEIFEIREKGTLISGGINEGSCPSLHSSKQVSSMMKQGDVQAVFFGHDHNNTFQISYKGMDFVNTPTAGFSSYGDEHRGIRVIELDENDTSTYKTRLVNYYKTYCTSASEICRYKMNGKEYNDFIRALNGIRYFYLALSEGKSFFSICKEIHCIIN